MGISMLWGLPRGRVVRNLPTIAGNAGNVGSVPRLMKIPWRREWQHPPVFLPGKSHGQRSLGDYIQSMGSKKKSDTTERLTLSLTF